MEQKNEEIAELLARREEGEAVNLRVFFYKLLSYWYLFLPAVLIGLGVAMAWNWYARPTYAVTGSLFVKEKDEESISIDNLFDNLQLKSDVKIPNHLGILASFNINRQVIENLGWHVTWFAGSELRGARYRGEDPYVVVTDSIDGNPANVPLHIKRRGRSKYVIHANSRPVIDGKKTTVKFRQEGTFGEPFKNEFFSFTLTENVPAAKGNFYFMFNDQDGMTLDYMRRLKVTRLDKNMDLIGIRLITDNPEKDISYVNELEHVYASYGLEEKRKASENAIRFIDRQLAAVADSLGKENELYSFLLERRSEAEVAMASGVSEVEIIDVARDSTVEDVGPRKMINLLMGLFLGLALPFMIVVLKEFFDETVRRREEIEKLTPVPVIGSIMHHALPGKIPVLKHPGSALAESFRELRIGLDAYGENPVVFGVHSMRPEEGKTFVALNLACVIAMNHKKVVLVDANLRKADLHRWADLKNEHGLSSFLGGSDDVDQIILPVGTTDMYLIPAGPAPANPGELLGTVEFERLISHLKQRFDVIIIDNAPTGLVTEGAIVRRHTDIDLFVVRQGRTRKKSLDALTQKTAGQRRKTAVVFNDIREDWSTGSLKRDRAEDGYFS